MILTENFSLNNPLHMMTAAPDAATLLTPADGPPVTVINPGGAGPLVLVCEHASNRLPARLGDLGLGEAARASHIAWDPGALGVALRLSEAFDAPLVAARFSRLACDCNRAPERDDAVIALSETTAIPGNAGLDPGVRAARTAAIHAPFHALLADTIARHRPRAMVTVHSFTPVYAGQVREVELGLLHDADARLAHAMLPRAGALTGLRTALNAPYGPGDGVTHTLVAHALPAGIANVMIEIRSDRIADPAAECRVAAALAATIREGMLALARGS